MTKSRKRCGKSKGRGKRGGALSPLGSGNYPGSTVSGGQWSTSVGGNPLAQAANSHQTLLGRIAADSGGAGANPALAREMLANYAMKGPGQSGGGSRRHKRRGNHSKRMRKSQSQSQGQAQSQSGGMFATFGALLKEALVPLGLLAAQQAYGRSYGKKNRTRKNRK
jgi:hypothetical protein